MKLHREQCYQISPGKHEDRIKRAAQGKAAPFFQQLALPEQPEAWGLPGAMDLKGICVLSVILVVALIATTEGKTPPSKYIYLLLLLQVCMWAWTCWLYWQHGHVSSSCIRQWMSCSDTVPKAGVFLKSLSEKAMAATTAKKKTTGELSCWWHNREPATKVEGQKCSGAR